MTRFIPISKPSITEREVEAVAAAVRSGWVSSLGENIDRFEQEFARFCGTEYGIATSNGTTGLHLSLAACGIGRGDEVIVPDLTFVATANAVRYAGAIPVFVDISPVTLCIDHEAVRQALTPRTRAIIPVHLYGHPAEMHEIRRIADAAGLFVIEDAAEAHGAEVRGVKVGGLGHCGVFSFYGNKIMTCGEGGLITTNDKTIYERARHLRDHAMSKAKRYWHDQVGFNYRLTNIQAALALAQMERLPELLAQKARVFARYQQWLAPCPRIRLNRTAVWAKNVYWMVCVEIDGHDEERRNRLMQELAERGIDSRPYFYPISDLPMYQRANTPVAHRLSQCGMNLPSFHSLTDDEIDRVCMELLKLI